jgi:hypothetical protein
MGSLGDLGDDDSIQNFLEGMMGQLMGKDVLYEPLKELNDKVNIFTLTPFPPHTSITSSRPISLPMPTSFHRRNWRGIGRNIRVPPRSLPYSRTLNTKKMILR